MNKNLLIDKLIEESQSVADETGCSNDLRDMLALHYLASYVAGLFESIVNSSKPTYAQMLIETSVKNRLGEV